MFIGMAHEKHLSPIGATCLLVVADGFSHVAPLVLLVFE